jgi:hypothetical protein
MAHADPRRGTVATALLASVLATVIAAGGGCEIGIGGDVPAFECVQGPAVCPGNQVCDTSSHQCVAPCSVTGCGGGTECDPNTNVCVLGEAGPSDDGPGPDTSMNDGDAASTPDEAAPPADTGTTEGSGPCRTLGCKCGGGGDCDSGICADQLSVTPGLWSAAGSAGFCTQPCCVSADCDLRTVCFASGAGGDYCVNPLWVGRSVAGGGTKNGGSSCANNSDCRSGFCAGTSCADTCCSTGQASSQCASGTTCRFGNFPGGVAFDKNYVAYCDTSQGNGQNGSGCSSNNSCRSSLCASDPSNVCHDACRNSAECGSQQACQYVLPQPAATPAPVVAACFSSQGNTPQGGSCNPTGSTCQSGFCDPNASVCTDVCFANSDCTKTGWRCRPETVPLQGGGSYSVLACGT